MPRANMRLVIALVIAALCITPLYTQLTVYITELPAYSSLTPCAANRVSWNVDLLTQSLCPSAAAALASCACFDNQNSYSLSKVIGSEILSPGACGSAATHEQRSGLAVFASYCSLASAAAVVTGGATSSKSSHTN
jgi:hypothetical protein